jgi:molecular chaperone GrpE
MSEAKETQTETENQKTATEKKDEETHASAASQDTQTKAKDLEDTANKAVSEESEAESPPSTEEFARMKAEYEARYDQMLRTIADFENSKKRAEREKEEFLKYAIEGMVKDLIPVVDNIERAIESTKESKDFDSLNEGIELIHKQLFDLLERRGVTTIKAVGEPFDPTQHEAVMHVESDDVPENAVIEEFQRGYLLHNRVIRPPMVSVSRGKAEKEETSPVAEGEGEKEERSNE